MPLVVPIYQAGQNPVVTQQYVALGSIGIANASQDSGYAQLDISNLVPYTGIGSIEVQQLTKVVPTSSISIVQTSQSVTFASIEVVSGDGFLILLDAIEEELSDEYLANVPTVDINALLIVIDPDTEDELSLAIKSFNFQAPTGRLGSLLNVVLAEPDTVIPIDATIKFQLVINIDGVDHFVTLMDGAKLTEKDAKIAVAGQGKPADELTFGALDVIADKFSLAPRKPVTMFDPYRVRYDEVEEETKDAIRTDRGQYIMPTLEPVIGLNMKQILNRAYGGGLYTYINTTIPVPRLQEIVTTPATMQSGCGFSAVITNIPNYNVRRADFTLEGGWHDGAQPVVAMFAPVYFVDGANRLFIIDPDKALPYGVSPKTINISSHKSLTQKTSVQADRNAVLLTYQYSTNDPSEDAARQKRLVYSEVVDETDDLDPGNEEYIKVTTKRWDYEFFLTGEAEDTLATFPHKLEVETRQTVLWSLDGETVTNYGVHVTHKEETEYRYDSRGEFLLGSTKTIYAILNVGSSSFFTIQPVEREETTIIWMEDPYNPGVKLQARVIIRNFGLVYHLPVGETIILPTTLEQEIFRRVPVLVAQRSGVIEVDSLTSLNMVKTKTINKYLRRIKHKQYQVNVVEVDHLNNTVHRSYADPVTGSSGADEYGAKSRTVLFRDLDSEAEIGPRVPVAVNSYELPRTQAYALARNSLRRIKNPLGLMPIDLPGVSLSLTRGSVIKGQTRDGHTGNYFVTGYAITGQSLGKQGHRISESVEALELLDPEEEV